MTANAVPEFLQFWGKAKQDTNGLAGAHPLAFHLLDVAAVARALLESRPVFRKRISQLLDLDERSAAELLVTLIALHDVGKFSPTFQRKSVDHLPAFLTTNDSFEGLGRHVNDGFQFWGESLSEKTKAIVWPTGHKTLDALAPAIFGHHGRPPQSPLYTTELRRVFGDACLAAANSYLDTLSALLGSRAIQADDLTKQKALVASWWIAGFTTLADWIGSNSEWFEYRLAIASDGDLRTYWEEAQERARYAVRKSGLMQPQPSRTASARDFLENRKHTPTQKWAAEVPIDAGPHLFIIEDVTGSGKTEAAQILISRLLQSGQVSGAYWAMPTQATANAMYERQRDAIRRLYESNAEPSLVLAHGQQRLHDGFRSSVIQGFPNIAAMEKEPAAGDDENSAANCAAFFADDRRAALLADIGAGTVDQALLAILPSKFNALRLLGLADKALVIDEAHAYDAYMGVELQELLRFQAALGGSAIVLSATLPIKQRHNLERAWSEGARRESTRMTIGGQSASPTIASHYPQAVHVSGSQAARMSTKLEAAAWSRHRVGIKFVHDLESAIARVESAHAAGAAVAWIRNTVDDCLAAADELRQRGVPVTVFHARFAQIDRQAHEQEIVSAFGGKASAEDRRAKVVLSTQVLQESLDLDFDVMISDIAPIDLLIQRAGRLWRHPKRDVERPLGLVRELIVLAPEYVEDPSADWLSGIFSGSAYVYDHPGILWKTAKVLHEEGCIETPGGMRHLIESVYDGLEGPESFVNKVAKAESKQNAQAAVAKYAALKLLQGYSGSQDAWINDVHAPTRLSERKTLVRLARVSESGAIVPWADLHDVSWKAWALSEVVLSRYKVPEGSVVEGFSAKAIAAVKREWPKYEKNLPLIPLRETERGWEANVKWPNGNNSSITYTSRDGVAYSSAKGMADNAAKADMARV